MISFLCQHCGQKVTVSVKHIGKKGFCPKCRKGLRVPADKKSNDGMVRFKCFMCAEEIAAMEDQRGEIVDCGECGYVVQVPWS